jgi:5-methylcytosine-specific restriction enzyme A
VVDHQSQFAPTFHQRFGIEPPHVVWSMLRNEEVGDSIHCGCDIALTVRDAGSPTATSPAPGVPWWAPSEASDEELSTMGVRGRPTKWDRWYSSDRWARIRRHQLLEHPLCKYCAERGIVTPATICDHVEPHRGDINRFWCGPFQSLCEACHRSAKRWVELRGYRPDIGLDGWPLDPNHPANRGR